MGPSCRLGVSGLGDGGPAEDGRRGARRLGCPPVAGLGDYAIVAAVAAGTTFALTPVVRRLSIHIGAVVAPDARRVHATPTPTLGGLAMYAGLLAAMATAWRMDAFD